MSAAPLPSASLDGRQLADALRAGIYRVIGLQEPINRINVFPVPDGDTGTNLALTLQAVLAALKAGDGHAGQTLTRVADAALDGARGNSGAILAQFFLGLGDRGGHLRELSVPAFVDAVGAGARYAREAMAEPREGTILSVLNDFAGALAAAAQDRALGFPALFRAGLEVGRRSLEATRDQLESLRRANVVDAGAMGFVELVAGMAEYLETGRLDVDESAIELVESEEAAVGAEEDLTHRYCTECMVTGEDIDRRKLREQASTLGSCLVVAGTHRKVRLHLHTNEPAKLFELAARHGKVSAEKADDMQRQQGAAHHPSGRRVAVVTDSAADLPDSVMEKLDIHLVPVRVHFGSRSYLDKVTLSPEQFFRELAESPVHPKTSQPPPGDFRRAYEFLGSHFDAVVYVGLLSKVSGTFQSGEGAAARARTRARIVAVDSLNASLGQGLVVQRAAEVAAAGGDVEAVERAAREAREQTFTWACLGTLEYAVRGGRVPRWVQPVADLLRLVPILAVRPGGRFGLGGALFGRRERQRRFGEFVRRRLDPARRWRVAVAHANDTEGAGQVCAAIAAEREGIEFAPVIPLGTALGVHGGPGCIVVAAQPLAAPGG